MNQSPSADLPSNEQLESMVWNLEQSLVENPGVDAPLRQLLNLLDIHQPAETGKGQHSDLQGKLAANHVPSDWSSKLVDLEEFKKSYSNWRDELQQSDFTDPFCITQLFVGKFHSIQGTIARCGQYIGFFNKFDVIPRICTDCYKVKVLPHNVAALLQTYFVFRKIKLPKDNSRKCMVELRDPVAYPYKGYIFCDSEENVKNCVALVEEEFRKHEIVDVRIDISHGCSGYGLKYPDWKYSEDGSHRSFERPESWDKTESNKLPLFKEQKRKRADFNKPGLSLKDIVGFRTWFEYAAMIGDETYKQFDASAKGKFPEPLAGMLRGQAEARHAQMLELQGKAS